MNKKARDLFINSVRMLIEGAICRGVDKEGICHELLMRALDAVGVHYKHFKPFHKDASDGCPKEWVMNQIQLPLQYLLVGESPLKLSTLGEE